MDSVHEDERGCLVSIELDDVPFTVRRVFTVARVPEGMSRGGHSHRRGTQALFCVAGLVDVEIDGPEGHRTVRLAPGAGGVVLPPGTWARQTYVTADAVLLVLASDPYDPATYDPARPASREETAT